MKARQGMAELGKPGYDKRLWDDSDSWLKAPTLREVTEIALEVVGSATGQQWWLGYVDDALFAGMDLGGGYKTVEQIGNELGKKALTQAVNRGVGSVTKWAGNAAGTALSKSGKAANIFAQAGISAAGSYAGSVANNYVNALDLSKLGTKEWMNWEAGNAGWTRAGSVSGALSAGIRSGMGSAFGTMGAATNKFYGGAMSLATSAATQAATYGTYVAFNGGNFGAAYEAMGGITLNVANLGSMVDMVGTGIARTNSTGQSRLGSIARKLSNTGLLEVNIGSSGITGRIGMGGIDVGGNLYNLAKRMNDKASLEAYKAEYGDDKGNAAYNAYVYGDWTQENTAARLASEIDQLEFVDRTGKETDWNAQTTSNGNGGRTIEMLNSGNDYNNAITLGHEAHRDGISGPDNYLETRSAVTGHTEMAIRMLRDGQGLSMSANLQNDIGAYMMGQDVFNAYVDGSYDSSGDYWKLVSTKDGRHSLEYDGSRDLTIEYKDRSENGEWETVGTDKIADTTGSMAGSLAKILGAERAEELLGQSLHNSNVYDTQTLMDVLGISENAASQIKDRGALPAEVSELQLLKLAGEALMKNNGFTYDTDTMKWDAGRTTNLTLTDNLTKGYISFNNIDDTNYDRFVVTAELARNNNSWDATMGIPETGSLQDNNRGLDSVVYTKYNLQNEVQDWYVTKSVQSIDVFNAWYDGADRNQAMDSPLFKNLQGNTVMTDFSLSIDSLETTHKWAMTIHNARTLDGDWINKAGIDTEPGGAWGLHEGTSLTSDGCFMYRENDLDLLQNKLSSWGMRKNHQIAGIMYNSWYADYIQRTAVKRPR